MAGSKCPQCGKLTFFGTSYEKRCKCGYQMKVPPNGGKGGKGNKCSNCGAHTVFNAKCTQCGAKYSLSKKLGGFFSKLLKNK
nr:hypothetical protein [uncultured Helicobacter sp.]